MSFIDTDGLETAALTSLIQFSSDQWSHEQLKELNCGDRIVNNLKEVILFYILLLLVCVI